MTNADGPLAIVLMFGYRWLNDYIFCDFMSLNAWICQLLSSRL